MSDKKYYEIAEQELKDNYIELTSSEYVRKEPEDKIVSKYECKSWR
jgi:hypothetical protein